MKNTFLKLMNFQNGMIIVLMLVLTACIDKTETPQQTPIGFVNLYNAAPYGPSLDVYLNDNAAKINQTPFDYSKNSGYINFSTGSMTLKFNEYNTTTKLFENAFTVDENTAYSLFVINEGLNQSTILFKDVSELATASTSRLRFIHLSPNPSLIVDLKVTGANGETFFENKSFKSASEFKEVPFKTYSFDLINKADGTVLTTITDVNLAAGKYYTIVAKGFDEDALPAGNNNKITLQLLNN